MFLSLIQTSCIVQSGLHSDPSNISAIWRSSQYLYISNISEKWRCCQYILANINKRKPTLLNTKQERNQNQNVTSLNNGDGHRHVEYHLKQDLLTLESWTDLEDCAVQNSFMEMSCAKPHQQRCKLTKGDLRN